MTHKEYLEMLIGPLAGEGGGGDVPSGSVTLTQNTGPSGVNIADKASAVVQVQGGVDASYVFPSVPSGYTELHETAMSKTTVQGYTAGQTNKQITTKLPLWMTLNNGDKIALTGYAQETGEPFVIAGTVTGTTKYDTYFYPKLTIDYDGYVGDSPVIPSGYTEIKCGRGLTRNKVLSYQAGGTRTDPYRIARTESPEVGAKVCLTGVTYDTNEPYAIAGTVYSINVSTNYNNVTINPDHDGSVGVAVGLYVSTNPGTDIDVKGREFVKLTSELIKPTGTLPVSQNGIVDVSPYQYADVNIQAPPSGGSAVVDFEGVRDIGENGMHADSNNPNTTITMLRFPNLETLNAGNFGFFTGLTDIYFGPNFSAIKGNSFDMCSALSAVYFDSWAGNVPYITSGTAPGQGTQCIYYMPNSLISAAQWDPNWSSLYQMNRLVDLDRAPYSPVVLYRPGQKCIFQGYQWENQSSGRQPGVPGDDPAWMQIGPA